MSSHSHHPHRHPVHTKPQTAQPRQTAKEMIAANVKPHRAARGRTLGCTHRLPQCDEPLSQVQLRKRLGNRAATPYRDQSRGDVCVESAWPPCEKGREGNPHSGSHHRHQAEADEEAEKDITKQNTRVLVGFRNAYVFDVEQTEGVDLPAMREVYGEVGDNYDRLAFVHRASGDRACVYREHRARPRHELRWTHRHPARPIQSRDLRHTGA